ncbi:EAL domain-containing protein, partial [Escherichia coli]|nr:EAL domain-containing protein [Escherichia coli]MCK2285390.1 EAL domain-containing protein [Escherichia coli]
DRNRSHWSTSKTPSYTKSVSWQHHPYLHDLHIDYIKIDHSFVGRVNADPDSTRILDCVLDLARKLSISIVAEGVETKAQLDYLNQNNITFQQGYYFYKPVTYIELIKIILSKPKVKVIVE